MSKNFYPILFCFIAMVIVVALSNYLVLFPINDWLTWGAFSYPISFLLTELTNRFFGSQIARKVVYLGFAVAVILSIFLATPRIAFASGFAFLVSQLLDISIFNRLRQYPWWYAPFFASLIASAIDTMLFWQIAFLGEGMPLMYYMTGDFFIKVAIDILMLTPFRFVIRRSILLQPIRH